VSRNLIPEYVIQKVGGRFKLSALLQKRMQQLNRGAPRLVDIDTDDPMKIALAELMADRISLGASAEEAAAAASPAVEGEEVPPVAGEDAGEDDTE
jgi:DNA-directed RNA polymerase subunit omega